MDIEVVDNDKNTDLLSDQSDTNPEIDFDNDELNLDPGIDNSTDDPVRMYLREMGSIQLLTAAVKLKSQKKLKAGILN
ncbi:MAG: hypothetical protein Ct9H300mP28_21910 [Pseudomonadota bacterium]|nr:MAG: hypothetical protein Ct9H300mP28_21910 [Pseudomonadota bacterium]